MIRVVIVEDSRLYQMYLRKVLESDDYIQVCGCASTGKEALEIIEREQPDVISLDLHLPDVAEYDLLKKLVSSYKIPIIVVTSTPGYCEHALRLGAKDFIEKAVNGDNKTLEQFSLLLRLKIKTQGSIYTRETKPVFKDDLSTKKPSMKLHNERYNIIAVGASLGGTEAILELLQSLPKNMPGIVVVQHMPPGFTKAYAMRLNKNCSFEVVEAEEGMLVKTGRVIIAKGGEHLTVYKTQKGYCVHSRSGEKVSGFCPSVDTLFDSVANTVKEHAVGVILTGIGRDGAKGLLHMHEQGAYTIGQNEESCVVYGMPAAAKMLGAVDREVSLSKIRNVLINHFEK